MTVSAVTGLGRWRRAASINLAQALTLQPQQQGTTDKVKHAAAGQIRNGAAALDQVYNAHLEISKQLQIRVSERGAGRVVGLGA